MTDIVLESVRAFVLFGLVLFLVHTGRTRFSTVSRGWNWIIGGFCLLLFGSLLDITDNFETLNRFVVIGDTEAEAFLEKFVGFLGGFVVLAFGLVQWIPEQLAEHRQTEELLTATIDSLPEGFLYFDADDRLVLVNSTMADIYPLAADVFVPGVSYETCMRTGVERGQWGPDDGQDEEEWIQERLAYHYDPEGSFEFNTPDGRCIRVEEKKTPDGGIVGIRTDITEIKKAEKKIEVQRDELAKLNEQKDKFFSIIAHDLRSPFTALLGNLSLLSEGIGHFDKAEVKDSASSMYEAAQRVFRLLENLLEWSRLQMGGMEFEPNPIDLKDVIDANLVLFTPVAEEKGIRLRGERKESLTVFADAQMVDTVVRNLINNAIKFTAKGGTITVTERRNSEWAEVAVVDTGVGMSANQVANLFRLDKKSSTAGTEGEMGTGLGLDLCKELVEMQGGEIRVESTQGKGSTFSLTLPLHRE